MTSIAVVAGVVGSEAVHLLALCESSGADIAEGQGVGLLSQSDRARFGIAFLDAAAGRFYIGSATDDAGRANLGAILMQASLLLMQCTCMRQQCRSDWHVLPCRIPKILDCCREVIDEPWTAGED